MFLNVCVSWPLKAAIFSYSMTPNTLVVGSVAHGSVLNVLTYRTSSI